MTDFENDDDYEECLVTFFDVLGFKNLLNTRSAAEISELLSTFRFVSEGDATPPTRSDEMRMTSEVHAEIVSDAIVRVRTIETQYQVGALVWELIDLLHIQTQCLMKGILVRGAMTIGHMHLKIDFSGPVFGPGLVQAYEMEEREVIFPRIAIHEDVIERHQRDGLLRNSDNSYEDERKHLNGLLCEDEAGLRYIDYLRASLSEFDAGYVGWLDFLHRHKELIEGGLRTSPNATVKRKFSWMKNYHNGAVDEALARLEPDAALDDGQSIEEFLRDLRIEE